MPTAEALLNAQRCHCTASMGRQPTISLRRLTMLPARAARVQHGASVEFDDVHGPPAEKLEKTEDREGSDEIPIIDYGHTFRVAASQHCSLRPSPCRRVREREWREERL